jgi:tetratricopeptide (TPR) repeat protein
LTEHPSLAEISALLSETLPPKRQRQILAHLLFECTDCLAQAPKNIRILLKFEGPATSSEEEQTEADAAIDRAFNLALRHQRHLDRERKDAKKAEKILAKGGLEATTSLPLRMGALAKMEALLTRSWALRHENPKLMVQFALLAAECAEQLEARVYGIAQVYDFKCRAQAELGNAYRVLAQVDNAEFAFGLARRFFELGSRNELLEVRLLNLEASLYAEQLRYKEACTSLAKVHTYYLQNGNYHLAGRALLKRGLYEGYAGDEETALRLLSDSLKLIDAECEPSLAYAVRHNQIVFLVDLGDFREAEKQLFRLRPLQHHAGGRIPNLHLRWIGGRIDAGLGRSDRAENIFREVREASLELNRAYDSALASLDLAAVLLAQRKAREATKEVTAASKIFIALHVDREAFMTVIMLRTACEMQLATQTMVEQVAKFLRRFENDPSARFES